jgi:hypothetical protein
MLGKQQRQRTLLDAELWAGRELVPADSFYGRFAAVADGLVTDDRFAACYKAKGRPSISPALLTKVLLLALHDGCSDRKAIEQMRMHLGWKKALGLALDDPGCHPTTLTVFRARLILHDLDRGLFIDVVQRAVGAGLLAKRAVQTVDSSAILGAGAVQDTYTLLRKALQKVVGAAGSQLSADLRTRLVRYADGQKAAIDWDDATVRRGELQRLAGDARATLAELPAQTGEAAAEPAADGSVSMARALLEQVLAQDVEEGSDGQPQIRRGVARHRVPSTTDPEMRHGRKSSRRKWTGYKQHIMTDPETELVTAVAVSPASTGDGALLPELLTGAAKAGLTPSQVVGDQAYGGGALRAQLAQAGTEIVAKAAAISNGAFFSKDAFVIDLEAGTVRCPAQHTARITEPIQAGKAQRVLFPTELCAACPLRAQCVRGKAGRSITIGAYEGQRQRARALQGQPATQVLLQLRPRVERKLAHLIRWGSRQARYLGRRKVGLQLFLVGLLANLERIGRLALTHDGLVKRLVQAI